MSPDWKRNWEKESSKVEVWLGLQPGETEMLLITDACAVLEQP